MRIDYPAHSFEKLILIILLLPSLFMSSSPRELNISALIHCVGMPFSQQTVFDTSSFINATSRDEEKYFPILIKKSIKSPKQHKLFHYEEVINEYNLPMQVELTDHLLNVLDLMDQYLDTSDRAIWQQYRESEDALLKKYSKTLKPYADKYFYKYFDFDLVLAEKEIYSTEEFNRLTADEQGLTLSERQLFIRVCRNTLDNSRTFLQLRREPENKFTDLNLAGQDEPDKEATKAR